MGDKLADKKTIQQTILEFQAGFQGVEKKRVNTFTQSKYANLDDVWNAIKPRLQELQISVIQVVDILEGEQVLRTIVENSDKDKVESIMQLLLEKQTPQGIGAALTYARRYSLCCILGIVETEDDDANSTERTSEQLLSTRQKGEIMDFISATETDIDKFTTYLSDNFGKEGIDSLSYSEAATVLSQLKSKHSRLAQNDNPKK